MRKPIQEFYYDKVMPESIKHYYHVKYLNCYDDLNTLEKINLTKDLVDILNLGDIKFTDDELSDFSTDKLFGSELEYQIFLEIEPLAKIYINECFEALIKEEKENIQFKYDSEDRMANFQERKWIKEEMENLLANRHAEAQSLRFSEELTRAKNYHDDIMKNLFKMGV
jgi:hypothetical protein